MNSSAGSSSSPTGSLLPVSLALILPGAGQVYLKRRWRGMAIFGMVVMLALLIQWALDNFKIGLIQVGNFTTSWLWLIVVLFWAWNVFDAYRLSQGRSAARGLAFV